jgi:hypothetical protein
MEVEDDHSALNPPRAATLEDLVELCRELNAQGAIYVVVGGFAIRAAGFVRETMDIDLVMDVSLENERKVYRALEYLPDKAVKELEAGEVGKYTVVRVHDDITVDLMQSACGIDYQSLVEDAQVKEVDGVLIPFASPKKLWLMKQTYREKDIVDRLFLKQLLGDDLPPTPPLVQL